MIKKIFKKNKPIDFNLDTIYKGHYNVKYRGIEMLHNPFDYLLYQMLIFEVQPDLIIEIGTNKGASSLYFSDLLDIIGDGGVVHTIDVENKIHPIVKNKPNIKFFLNGFENYDLSNTHNFKKIMVIDDGSHMYEDVKKALEKFSSIVSLNSYFIVEDGIISYLNMEKRFNGGPLKAINEFLNENKNFIIDTTYCNFFGKNATFNVNGYLKKIK
jgi:cephalosporin hydroxylase